MSCRLVAVLLILFPVSLIAQESEQNYFKTLGLPSDHPFLLEYLKQRSRESLPADELNALLKEFSAEETWQAAFPKLVQRGPVMIPGLRRLKNDITKPELVKRATTCLSLIEGRPGTDLTSMVLKSLANSHETDAVNVILEFVPHAEDATVLEMAGATLTSLAYQDGQPSPALVKAINHSDALVRMLTVEALVRSDQPKIHALVFPLLEDPVRLVKQRTAIALAKADEIRAIPVLVNLLTGLSKVERAPIEEMLNTLAAETAPKGLPNGDLPADREAVVQGWQQWWQKISGNGLLEEFRSRTLLPNEIAIARDLVNKLGDQNYRTREKATETLGKMGAKVLPFLREASKDTDGERSRRAEECMSRINSSFTKRLPAGVPRLTAMRRQPEAVSVMLEYVPFIDDDEAILAEIRTAITKMALDVNSQPSPVLLKSLDDRRPIIRSLVAEALCKGAGPSIRSSVKKLLADSDLTVRQTAGIALMNVGEKEAVPVLINLLAELPTNASWPTQDALQVLAGEVSFPPAASDKPEDRKAFRDQWNSWWNTNSAKIDVAKQMQTPGYLGYTLIVQVQNNSNGRVIEIGRDGKIRWKIDNLRYPVDAFMMPGERVLITEWDGNRVTEYDTRGNVIWKKDGLAGRATNANRLASGNTFISTTNEVLEVDPTGKEVYKFAITPGVTASYRASSGEIICLRNDGKVVRYNTAGTEIKTFESKRDSSWTSGLDLLRNGNILVTQPNPGQKVTEFTVEGKVVHEWSTPGVTTATRLINGNLLACSHGGKVVIEYDRSGKKVWEYRDEYHIFRARRR